jgi:hypothetical protein
VAPAWASYWMVTDFYFLHVIDDWDKMTDTKQELDSIKSKIDFANLQQARQQAKFDHAKEQLDLARKELKEKYGVSTMDEAKVKLAEIKNDLNALTEQALASLAKFDELSAANI